MQQSCCVLVLMNDETVDSTWCCAEWQAAMQHGVPIKVVADMQRFAKAQVLKTVQRVASRDALLEFQWVRKGRPRARRLGSGLWGFWTGPRWIVRRVKCTLDCSSRQV